MKALRRGVLGALLLTSAVVVVAAPAFATPRLTTSTANVPDGGAVSPFWTPIGSTTSNSVTITHTSAARRGLSISGLNASGLLVTATCRTTNATAFAGLTHTRLTVSSLSFTGCTVDGLGLAVTVTTRPPYFLHERVAIVGHSWEGVLELPAASEMTIRVTDPINGDCELSIRPQSIFSEVTDEATTLVIESPFVVFNLNRGPPRTCPDHRTNGTLTVTIVTDYVYAVDTKRTRITEFSR
jgi:hypothetical protein